MNQNIPNFNNVIYCNNMLIDIVKKIQNAIRDIYNRKQADVIVNQLNNVVLIMNNIINTNNQISIKI